MQRALLEGVDPVLGDAEDLLEVARLDHDGDLARVRLAGRRGCGLDLGGTHGRHLLEQLVDPRHHGGRRTSAPSRSASRRERPRPGRPRRRLARPPARGRPRLLRSSAPRRSCLRIRASRAAAVLVSKVLVTVSIPADAISIGTRLGCGVNISERPTSCSASMLPYATCARRSSTSRCIPRGSAIRLRPSTEPTPKNSHSGAEDPALDRLGQRDQPELEEVALRVRLGARVEEQPAGSRESASSSDARGLNRGDRVLEIDRVEIATLAPGRVDALAVRREPPAQERGREEAEMGEVVGLPRDRRPGTHHEGEGLVLLDQVEEPLGVRLGERVVGMVRRPPGRCDEAIVGVDRERRGIVAGEGDLQPGQGAGRGRCRTRPARASSRAAAASDRR